MTLLRLDASIRVEDSASEIADIVEGEWPAVHHGDAVEHRHTGSEPLPPDPWAAAVTAGWDHSSAYPVRILRDARGADRTAVEREFTFV